MIKPAMGIQLKSAVETYEDHGLPYAQAREQLQAAGETYASADLERAVRASNPQKIIDDIIKAGKGSFKNRIKLEMLDWISAFKDAI